MSTVSQRLNDVFEKATEISFDNDSKIILMSDCHRGSGSLSDNFRKNQNIFQAALNHYLYNGYTYIEIGDGEELWENRNISNIIREYRDIYMTMSEFYKLGRLYLIYGNHDFVKKDKEYVKNKYYNYYDEKTNEIKPLFHDINMYEGLILNHKDKGYKIFLVHGHQGDFLNEKIWRATRFLVRHLWRHLELYGINDPTSASKNNRIKNNTEKRITEWSNERKQMIITGHTHRPILPNINGPLYFNTGSCIYPRGITGIEISDGNIMLVRWSIKVAKNNILYIGKDILEGPIPLSSYFESPKRDKSILIKKAYR